MDSLDRQLRYFLKIAQFSSLSKAAEELDVSQSGLSRQLSVLEAYLGKPIFVRTGRGVALTGAGEKLAEVVGPAYDSIDQILDTLREREGITEGSLRIATIHTLSYYFVSDLLARFITQHERVNLSVMARSSPDVVDLVEKGKADIGFVYDSAVASDMLDSVVLLEDEMCLMVQAGRLSEDLVLILDACPLQLVGFPEHYALRRMLKNAGLDDRVVAEAETIDSMLRLVSLGVGACILPVSMPSRLLADYGLVKVSLAAPGLRRRVVAIVRCDTPTPSLARQLLKMAVTHRP